MKIQMAHLRKQGISFAVFAADAPSRQHIDRSSLLADLTRRARASGLRVDKSALAYSEGGRTRYYGTPDLIWYLASNGVSQWTHTLEV